MTAKRKTLVFPIEIITRELDGKLLLALSAREQGWDVLIGGMSAIKNLVPTMPPSVYFAKSARSTNAKLFARLRKLGHDVVVLDEEVLVRQSDDIYLLKHEQDALKNVNLLLTWGQDSLELWQRSGMLHGIAAEASGNPRVDMLMPELRAYHAADIAAIRERFGEFLLFNSNFGTVNNKVTGAERFNLASRASGAEVEKDSAEYLAHKRAIFERFKLLMPKLAAAIAPRTLVIRPHPAEDHGPWKEIAAGIDNVQVVFEGSVAPWLGAARALIHNGCTSAVEAAVMGTPVISYRPVTSANFDNPLPNGVGTECFSDDEVLAAARKLMAEAAPPLTASQSATLRRHIAFNPGGLCADAIIAALARNSIGNAPAKSVPLMTWLKVYALHQKQLLPQRLKKLLPGASARKAYKKHKFSGLSEDILDARIERLSSALGRFGGIKARSVGKDLLKLG